MHLGHTGHAHFHAHGHLHHAHASGSDAGWLGYLASPSAIAVFLAWFGGLGYLLTRHSSLLWWIDLLSAVALGLAGAWTLATFLRFLQSRERPLDPINYQMAGVLGHVSSTIRPQGIGELVYLRDGARHSIPARSEDGTEITRGEEVIVTRYEKGIAFVRTWDAMTK
jgi:membrane protein implicated in regulation of membrane protease activity